MTTRVFLTDPDQPFRHRLDRVLSIHDGTIRIQAWRYSAASLRAVARLAAYPNDRHLAIVDPSIGPEVLPEIRDLRQRAPDIPVVAASLHFTPEQARGLLGVGVTAFLLKDAAPQVIVATLRAANRELFIIPPSLQGVFKDPPAGAPVVQDPRVAALSPTERRVTIHIINGDGNKAIANALNVQESTVKSHVRAIMRKTGLPSRQKIALWATAQNLTL